MTEFEQLPLDEIEAMRPIPDADQVRASKLLAAHLMWKVNEAPFPTAEVFDASTGRVESLHSDTDTDVPRDSRLKLMIVDNFDRNQELYAFGYTYTEGLQAESDMLGRVEIPLEGDNSHHEVFALYLDGNVLETNRDIRNPLDEPDIFSGGRWLSTEEIEYLGNVIHLARFQPSSEAA